MVKEMVVPAGAVAVSGPPSLCVSRAGFSGLNGLLSPQAPAGGERENDAAHANRGKEDGEKRRGRREVVLKQMCLPARSLALFSPAWLSRRLLRCWGSPLSLCVSRGVSLSKRPSFSTSARGENHKGNNGKRQKMSKRAPEKAKNDPKEKWKIGKLENWKIGKLENSKIRKSKTPLTKTHKPANTFAPRNQIK